MNSKFESSSKMIPLDVLDQFLHSLSEFYELITATFHRNRAPVTLDLRSRQTQLPLIVHQITVVSKKENFPYDLKMSLLCVVYVSSKIKRYIVGEKKDTDQWK